MKSELFSSMAVDALDAAGELCLRAQGRSMLPSMWPGDLLSVRPQDPETIVRGDVILFRRNGQLFTHRVVDQFCCKSGKTFIAQGDGLRHPDLPISQEDVLGRVVLVTRCGRSFEPPRDLSVAQQLLSAFARRIAWGSGVLVRGHALCENLKTWTPRKPQTSH